MRSPWPDWPALSTLRGRLTLWNTGIVLLMTLASLLAARLVARRTLYDDADAELRAGVQEVVLALADLYPDIDAVIKQIRRIAASHEQRGWFVHFLTEDGGLLWKSDHCPDAVVNFPPSRLDREENIVQVGPYRYVRHRIARPGLPVYHVRVGTYTTGLDDRLTFLVRQLAIVGFALLLLTPLAGWWLARRATRPIADILHSADHLRPTRLGDRLPVHGSRDELDRLSLTINGLLDNVADHVDRQRQFVADAAHELRGPLAAMQSSLEVAASKERSVADYRTAIDAALEECRRLSRLTNELLVLAEGESQAGATPGDVDLAALARQMAGIFEAVAEERGIRLEVEAGAAVRVRGDVRQLRQVCSNLLDNAIRFTPSGGRIDVAASIDEQAREACLIVSDTGRGIDERLLPRVFDRFFQAETGRDRSDPTRGGGLGLAICRAIVEGHRGSISVTSKPGLGSTFTVRLPIA